MGDRYRIEVEVLEGGTLPIKAHKSDAGFDLFASEDIIFKRGQIVKHPLNIKMKLPEGSYAHIKGKSGLGTKGLCLLAEIIDQNYRGIPHIVATNLIDEDIVIKKGQKIAQMIIHSFSLEYYITEVYKVDTDTDRGEGKFGSSGK